MLLRLLAVLLPVFCSGCAENLGEVSVGAALPEVSAFDSAALVLQEYQTLLRDDTLPPERFDTYLKAYPQTPDADLLRRRAEEAAIRTYVPPKLAERFARIAPVTSGGRIAYAEALQVLNRRDAAQRQAQIAYLQVDTGDVDARRAEALGVGGVDRWRRLVTLLDADRGIEARAMFGRVPPAWAQAATLYLNARTHAAAVLHEAEQASPGIRRSAPAVYARLRALHKLDRDAEAAALWLSVPEATAASMPLARVREAGASVRALSAADPAAAFRAAIRYTGPRGPFKPEADLLAARAARASGQPVEALRFAERAAAAAKSPILQARAQYEIATARRARGESVDERFRQAALRFPFTFYGQLAGAEAGLSTLPLPDERPGNDAAFQAHPFVRVAALAAARNERDTAVRFLVAYARAGENTARTAEAAEALGGPYARLRVGKAALNGSGTVSIAALYPQPGEFRNALGEPAFALAIARQESEFNPRALSRSGASGLMQLMPETARLTAAASGTPTGSLFDPAYNIRLGSTYLRNMQRRFGGSIIAASAAYNAGPLRVEAWKRDPATPARDPLAQIEAVPFDETRNYVQRVWENRAVYRALLANERTVHTLQLDDLRGS